MESALQSDEYYEDIRIDPSNLHLDLMDGPMLVLKWGEILANVKKAKENFSVDFDEYKADLKLSIIKNPKDFGIDKASVAAIDSIVGNDEKVIESLKTLNQFLRDIEVLGIVQKSFSYRKTALNDLVKLWLSSYGSDLFIDEQMKELLNTPEIIEKVNKINNKFVKYANQIKFKNKSNPEKEKEVSKGQTDAMAASLLKRKNNNKSSRRRHG